MRELGFFGGVSLGGILFVCLSLHFFLFMFCLRQTLCLID